MAEEGAVLKWSEHVVVFQECIGGLNNEKDVLFYANVTAWVIIMSDAQHIDHRRIHEKSYK